MKVRSSLSQPISRRPPVAKRSGVNSILTRQNSSRNLYKMEGKAATHDAMMQRFHLRKMSSTLGFPTKFGRANEVVIDKTIGGKAKWTRRFSLRRSLTGTKARQHALQTFVSPITPKSWTSTVHGIVMLAIYHLQLLYLPFSLSYYPDGSCGTTIMMIVFESIFLLDVLLNFNTAYVEQGTLVTSRKKIARNYIGKWFAFDLLSALPLQATLCLVSHSTDKTLPALQGIQLTLMVLRLLRVTLLEKGVVLSRVMRVANHLAEWVRYSRYSHLLGIAQLMWLVLLIAHYMACLWHVISRDHVLTQELQEIRAHQSVGEQYVADYYYAVSLIQGQGNSVGSWDENLYSSVAIIVGSVILAIVFGNVAMLVSNFNANTTNHHRKMEAVYATMDKMDLPLKLRERVKEYYTHVWLEYEALDGNINKFQQELTHTLEIEIGLYKHMNLVVRIPFWEDCTPDFLTQIVLNLGVRVYMPDDYVVRRREIGSEMMMINRGYCKLSKPSLPLLSAKTAEDEADSRDVNMPIFDIFVDQSRLNDNQISESEGDSDVSSDDDSQCEFGGGMFGSSMDSRRMSMFPFEQVDANTSNFTDVTRFRQTHPRRPSYPNGIDTKKPRRHREYLYPGQAFGEMSLLMNYKRTANIRAITFVEMCVLSRKEFQTIISRYPEDRRRVLRKMLESCIEKKVIPFPWENIIEAVSTKRRNSGDKDISGASEIATMTASEAARILVEAIDVNTPDETIRYGFQSFDQEFIEDSSLRHANSADAKISNTLKRRNSGARIGQSNSRRDSKADSNDGNASTGDPTETESEASIASFGGGNSDTTLENLLLLVKSMANNLERLQKDVSDLKTRDHCHCCKRCNGEKIGTNTNSVHRVASAPTETLVTQSNTHSLVSLATRKHEIVPTKAAKEDHQAPIPRKPSLVAIAPSVATALGSIGSSRHSGGEKHTVAVLRNIRSKENGTDGSRTCQEHSRRENPIVSPLKSSKSELVTANAGDSSQLHADGDKYSERYPANLSSRSKAARNQTLADILWKRSNTSGDLLKHTDEERSASRLRRQIRTRHSMPTNW
ncbi:unnamed protein product [Phytophthora lilii]|uniref:Unnamed protein product n=1 Tax=Phytophthora lilii TaxID=2077276 RepID=A0A9W6WPG6_9STRA|nr:unnamed protein product [Phytophthora lilii]